jgi:hypothetical protein
MKLRFGLALMLFSAAYFLLSPAVKADSSCNSSSDCWNSVDANCPQATNALCCSNMCVTWCATDQAPLCIQG